MKFLLRLLIQFSCLLAVIPVLAQDAPTKDFYSSINNYDFSVVWMADSLYSVWEEENNFEWRGSPDIYGFIGDDYQRFYIKLISAVKVPDKPNEYMLYGKTRVKGTVCKFIGTAKITEAKVYAANNKSNFTRGVANVEVNIYEDMKQASTGLIKGKLQSNFMIDKKGKLQYDGFDYHSDGFSNNQFTGTWTSYKTGNAKKCHFGDGRIPDCGDLDIGAGEFSVNEKYVKNGWESYMKSWLGDPETPENKKAKQEEKRPWWKD